MIQSSRLFCRGRDASVVTSENASRGKAARTDVMKEARLFFPESRSPCPQRLILSFGSGHRYPRGENPIHPPLTPTRARRRPSRDSMRSDPTPLGARRGAYLLARGASKSSLVARGALPISLTRRVSRPPPARNRARVEASIPCIGARVSRGSPAPRARTTRAVTTPIAAPATPAQPTTDRRSSPIQSIRSNHELRPDPRTPRRQNAGLHARERGGSRGGDYEEQVIEISTNRLYVHNLSWRVPWQDLSRRPLPPSRRGCAHQDPHRGTGPLRPTRDRDCSASRSRWPPSTRPRARRRDALGHQPRDGRTHIPKIAKIAPTAAAAPAALAAPTPGRGGNPASPDDICNKCGGRGPPGRDCPSQVSVAPPAPPRGRAVRFRDDHERREAPKRARGSPGPDDKCSDGAARWVTGPGTARCPATRTRRFARGPPASPSRMTSARSAGRRATGGGLPQRRRLRPGPRRRQGCRRGR